MSTTRKANHTDARRAAQALRKAAERISTTNYTVADHDTKDELSSWVQKLLQAASRIEK